MLEVLTAVAACVGALAGLWNGIEIRALRARLDHFGGRVDAIERAHNAHVNAPGLHGVR